MAGQVLNHLHKLIEAVAAGDIGITTVPELRPRESDAVFMLKHLLPYWNRAICFSGGAAERVVNDFQSIPALMRLPYPVTWFEFEVQIPNGPTVVDGSLCWQLDDDPKYEFHAAVFTYGSSAGWLYQGWWSCKKFDPTCPDAPIVGSPEDPGTQRGEWIAELGYPVQAFLSALNCQNVDRRVSHPPSPLQAARKRRGRLPLFSTWTLVLPELGKRDSGVPLGGVHASPRVHLRRGHPREFAPNKWTWVQPHAVGNRKLGVIHKDYAAAAQWLGKS